MSRESCQMDEYVARLIAKCKQHIEDERQRADEHHTIVTGMLTVRDICGRTVIRKPVALKMELPPSP